jgi:hypothetical protein
MMPMVYVPVKQCWGSESESEVIRVVWLDPDPNPNKMVRIRMRIGIRFRTRLRIFRLILQPQISYMVPLIAFRQVLEPVRQRNEFPIETIRVPSLSVWFDFTQNSHPTTVSESRSASESEPSCSDSDPDPVKPLGLLRISNPNPNVWVRIRIRERKWVRIHNTAGMTRN